MRQPARKASRRSRVPAEVRGLLELAQVVYRDACAECAVNPDSRDLVTLVKRTEAEGLSFLTITLPTFARDLERSLADRQISPKSFRAFGKDRAIPNFLKGMLRLVFDRDTGELLDSPRNDSWDISDAVAALRQVCRIFNKLQVPCTPAREKEALAGFVSLERNLAEFEVHEDDLARFRAVSRCLWDPCFLGFNALELVPKHGPGVTAQRTRGNSKYRWTEWHERLEHDFPILGFGLPLGAYSGKEFDQITFIPPSHERPSRVICVPKTLKGPRIIAAEPVAAQYAQQSLQSYLYDVIERYWITSGRINFRNQSENQRLALIGSKTGQWATLDLSDASDRVLNSVASIMFEGTPDLLEAVQSCRTTRADVNGTVVPLVKFASMGSALCFPVEAMYFYTICVVALLEQHSLPYDLPSILRVGREVRVYGDDIVVPVDSAALVADHLHKYHCKVNVHKSFWTGKFRESCGVDAYDGRMVTPTYVRHYVPCNRLQHSEIISLSAAANSFYKRGYWQTAYYLWKRLGLLLGELPVVDQDSPAIGRISFSPGNTGRAAVTADRYNPKLMRFEVSAWVVEPVYYTDELDGYAALTKCLLSLERRGPLDLLNPPENGGGISGKERRNCDENDYEEWLRAPLDVVTPQLRQRYDRSSFTKWLKAPREEQASHLTRTARHGVAALKRRAVPAT